MTFVDYYKILGIDQSATPKAIKDAFRKKARKHHPDLHPNDPDAKKDFQQINEANEVLSDPEKRRKYDQYGKDWQHAAEYEKQKQDQGYSSASRGSRYADNSPGGDFSDFFESMFGGNRRSNPARYRGEDLSAELHLKLLDAYETHQQTLTVNGTRIRITIPAGIENGQIIKIPAHGKPGSNGGTNGDLYLTFSIADHPRFTRKGNNLYVNTELDIYKAILGGELLIDTLNSQVKINVKPETQNGDQVKLKGKGFPVYKKDGQFGDLIVTYTIKMPTQLTDRQKELFTELSAL